MRALQAAVKDAKDALAVETAAAAGLRKELAGRPAVSEVRALRQQLRVLQQLEFNAGDDDGVRIGGCGGGGGGGGVVLFGMVLCRVVWCGFVRFGMVLCGSEWCDVVWCGAVWCGMILCGMVCCGMVCLLYTSPSPRD